MRLRPTSCMQPSSAVPHGIQVRTLGTHTGCSARCQPIPCACLGYAVCSKWVDSVDRMCAGQQERLEHELNSSKVGTCHAGGDVHGADILPPIPFLFFL